MRGGSRSCTGLGSVGRSDDQCGFQQEYVGGWKARPHCVDVHDSSLQGGPPKRNAGSDRKGRDHHWDARVEHGSAVRESAAIPIRVGRLRGRRFGTAFMTRRHRRAGLSQVSRGTLQASQRTNRGLKPKQGYHGCYEPSAPFHQSCHLRKLTDSSFIGQSTVAVSPYLIEPFPNSSQKSAPRRFWVDSHRETGCHPTVICSKPQSSPTISAPVSIHWQGNF